MKQIIILSLILILNFELSAQTTKYFDAPFGGGGGFTPAWYFPNVNPLNLKLREIGIPELAKNGLFTTGGGGYIYIGFVKNLRIGGMGFSGSTSKKVSAVNNSSEASYSLGGGGLTVEYTLPFIKDIGLSIGAILGAGGITIEYYKNTDKFSWDNFWNGSNNNSMERLTNNFWIISPTLNLDIPIYRFTALRIGAGYQFSLGNGWEANNEQVIDGVPSELNGNSFFIQAGLFIGFFSF